MTAKQIDDIVDGIIAANVNRLLTSDIIRVTPEMYYFQDEHGKTQFATELWNIVQNAPSAKIDENQSPEELGAIGEAYFVNVNDLI